MFLPKCSRQKFPAKIFPAKNFLPKISRQEFPTKNVTAKNISKYTRAELRSIFIIIITARSPAQCRLLALPTNIIHIWKGLPGTTTVAYYDHSFIMAEKVLSQWALTRGTNTNEFFLSMNGRIFFLTFAQNFAGSFYLQILSYYFAASIIDFSGVGVICTFVPLFCSVLSNL